MSQGSLLFSGNPAGGREIFSFADTGLVVARVAFVIGDLAGASVVLSAVASGLVGLGVALCSDFSPRGEYFVASQGQV